MAKAKSKRSRSGQGKPGTKKGTKATLSVELPIKKPRKNPQLKYDSLAGSLKKSEKYETDSGIKDLAALFTIVKIVRVLSDGAKKVEVVDSKRPASRNRSRARGITSSSSADENHDDETEEDRKANPKSRFDVMKYRAPSPPKRSGARRSSIPSEPDDADENRKSRNNRSPDSSSHSHRQDRRHQRSRTNSSCCSAGKERSRSRRSNTSRAIIAGRETSCSPLPLRGILKIRIGAPDPDPGTGTRRAKRKGLKKVKFRRGVAVLYYYCNLTKAKRYNRYRNHINRR